MDDVLDNPNPQPGAGDPPADPAQPPAGDPPADPAASDPPADPAANPQPAAWPDNWREQLAGDDQKLLGQLKRYGSPKSFAESSFALRQKLSSGEYKRAALPDNAKPEEVAAWRKENDIPETSDKYDLTLDKGLVIGEEDKELIDGFLGEMHKANAPQGMVKAALNAYYRNQEAQMQAAQDANEEAKTSTEDALRTEWGGAYRQNINMIDNLLNTAPAGVKDMFMSAVTPEGIKMLNNPDVMRFLADKAREINPVVTNVNGGGDLGKTVDDEIKALEEKMKNRDAWFKDTASQARYNELQAFKARQPA